jgi:hypothetical protein
MNTEHCIDICNRLLRGERSAVETYNQAIEKFRAEAASAEMVRLRDEHAMAVSTLEENVIAMSGTPALESEAWGALAHAAQGTANLFGENSALETLQTGEKTGKRDYEKALEDEDVMPACKDLIRTKLLPRIEEHIDALERLQKAA